VTGRDAAATAPVLPIGRERLQARLGLLSPADGQAVVHTRALLGWQAPGDVRGTVARQGDDEDRAVLMRAQALLHSHRQPAISELLAEVLGQRLLLAALRQQQQAPQAGPERLRSLLRGLPAGWPQPTSDAIVRRWHQPDFGLAYRLPWLPRARALLVAGDALGLQRLLDGHVWRVCDRLRARDRFAFSSVLAYAVQWDIADRWQRHDITAARRCLSDLLHEWLAEPIHGTATGTAATPDSAQLATRLPNQPDLLAHRT